MFRCFQFRRARALAADDPPGSSPRPPPMLLRSHDCSDLEFLLDGGGGATVRNKKNILYIFLYVKMWFR